MYLSLAAVRNGELWNLSSSKNAFCTGEQRRSIALVGFKGSFIYSVQAAQRSLAAGFEGVQVLVSFRRYRVWYGFHVNGVCRSLCFMQVRSGPPPAVTKLSWLLGTETKWRGPRMVAVEACRPSTSMCSPHLFFLGVIAEKRMFHPKIPDFTTWFYLGAGWDLES